MTSPPSLLLLLSLLLLAPGRRTSVLRHSSTADCECAAEPSAPCSGHSCAPPACECAPAGRAKRQGQLGVAGVFMPRDEPQLHKDSNRCNSESLEKVMLENIGDDVKQSKLRIMEAAEALLGGTFNVICAHGDFSYITSTKLYCLTGNEAVKCYAFLSFNQNIVS